MITKQFTEAVSLLNEAQRAAVERIEGPVMVIAGPGTGKTQVLTLRIANILAKTQVNPYQVLALTFTDAAVSNMKGRLVSFIGTPGYQTSIFTFHGFCNMLIADHREIFTHLIGAESITELEQIELMADIFASVELKELRPIGKPDFYYRYTLDEINELKKEGVTPEQFAEAVQAQEEAFNSNPEKFHEKGAHKGKMKSEFQKLEKRIQKNKELVEIYKEYQQRLKQHNMYDYNDMLIEVIIKMKANPDFLSELQEKYQYILVDEHQDTNSAQNSIVELLCGNPINDGNPNLFIVGDEKQSIYRFQGASLENFLYFHTKYPSAVLIPLEENYRSTQTILNAAISLIKNSNYLIQPKEKLRLQAKKTYTEEKIQVASFENYYAEYYYLVEDIKKKLEKPDASETEIAVIARNNADLFPLAQLLTSENIPFTVSSDQNILHDISVEQFLLLLRAIDNPESDAIVSRAMYLPVFPIHPVDIFTLTKQAREQKDSLISLACKSEITELKNFAEFICNWHKKSMDMHVDSLFAEVLHESGFIQHILNKEDSLAIVGRFIKIQEEIRKQMTRDRAYTLRAFIRHIDLLIHHNIKLTTANTLQPKQSVQLVTAHRSKGLEYDYVYIINAYDGHWGNQRSRKSFFTIPWENLPVQLKLTDTVDENEDERRLFFVALTRAKKAITITYARHNRDGKDQTPTQFINEIEAPLLEIVSTEQFEETLRNNSSVLLEPVLLSKHFSKEYFMNTKFFEDHFTRSHFSVTQLNNYLECPWRFFFKNVLHIPEEKEEAQKLGTAIHNAIHDILMMKHPETATEEQFMECFRNQLKRESASEREYNNMYTSASSFLPAFFTHAKELWKPNQKSELSIKGISIGNNIYLEGKLDLVAPVDGTNNVVVHDFKTSQPKSRNVIEGKVKDPKAGSLKRQLVFYKLLLDSYGGGKMKMDSAVLDFIKPNDRGIFKSEAFQILDEEVQELEEVIFSTIDEIRSLSFWDKHCDDPECEYCRLRELID